MTALEPGNVIAPAGVRLVGHTVLRVLRTEEVCTVRFNEQYRIGSVAATEPVDTASIELDRDGRLRVEQRRIASAAT